MVGRFVFLFLSRAIFRETSTEMDVKTFNVIVKNKSTTFFHGLYSYVLCTTEMTSKCSKLCSETTRLWLVIPLKFWTFWRHFYGRLEYRPWKIVVDLLIRRSICVLWQLVRRRTFNLSIMDQEKHELEQNSHLGPHDYQIDYVNIDLRYQYEISILEAQTSLPAKRL